MSLSRRGRPARLLAALLAVGASGAVPAAADAGTAPPPGKLIMAGAGAVPDDFVVVLRDEAVGYAAVPAVAARLAGAHRGRVGHTYRHALRGFQFRGDAAGAAGIAADPAVRYVAQSGTSRTAGGGTQRDATWGLDRIDQRRLPLDRTFTYPDDGAGATVYVVDTGIRYGHAEFGGRAVAGYDAITEGGGAVDCNGHGTHVAGTVGGRTYGVARAARLVGVRVLGCDGSSPDSMSVKGIDWIVGHANGPSVVNMSLRSDPPFLPTDDAVRHAIGTRNISFAVAAGNGDRYGRPMDACNVTPARVAEAVTVGATLSFDIAANYSNHGRCVDLFAPGSQVTSAWKDGDTATRTISGTSMATPHVAGVLAVLAARTPTATPEALAAALTRAATPDVLTKVPAGTPNLLLHLGPLG
ncbi:hypothetical protein GCM10010124_28270 [Pilimelia terevasa]|uniref:Peptidase S8/S53 domain-containing protein n=1 Tax=Pilimelia terevasa TaxID=53372 RepID=A0A8J3BPL2_9ACTN|nr:S8 family peptidase [Pilimelia terevasa]GGK34021.1 hypothetical protein GCM10010124_28270 [Pilimelia terevasa]